MITIIDCLTGEVYFQDEKKYYPTPEDVHELKEYVARNEGIDPSMIICKTITL